MQLAVVAAGFTPGEADRLRRAMAAWKRRGGLGPFEKKLIEGMRERGYEETFAKQIFQQIKGFGEYGFPESHAASFALLVYVSCWLKCHTPAAFTAALLNSQPMGFYSASQLIQDAQRHGVEVRGVDVNHSLWDCSLEKAVGGSPALRLGLRQVKGLSEDVGRRIECLRSDSGFLNVADLVKRVDIRRRDLEILASAGALEALSGHRYLARWTVAGVEEPTPLFDSLEATAAVPLLNRPSEGQDIVADYQSMGLSLGRHPLALLRARLAESDYVLTRKLRSIKSGTKLKVAGLVITKQRPMTASGVTFVTLEDETGHVNLVVWERIAEEQRDVLLNSRLMGVVGELQVQGKVIHVIAQKLIDHSELLGDLTVKARSFR